MKELLGLAQQELDHYKQKRAEVVGPLDRQIELLEVAVKTLAGVADVVPAAARASAPSNAQKVGFDDETVKSDDDLSPAQLVYSYLRQHPGSKSPVVIDRLYRQVGAKGGKSPRKVVSSAIYDLKRRGKIKADADGVLVLIAHAA